MLPVAAQVPMVDAAVPVTSRGSACVAATSASQFMQCGRELYEAGKVDQAAKIWQQAVDVYKRANNDKGVLEALIDESKALQTLGRNFQALDILEQVDQLLQSQPPSHLKVVGLRNLGDVLRAVGTLEKSEEVLLKSLEIARSPQDKADVELSLGNTYRVKQDREKALKLYQQAADNSLAPTTKIQAQLNRLSLVLETQKLSDADAQICGEFREKDTQACEKLREVQAFEALSQSSTGSLEAFQNWWPQIITQIKQLPPNRLAVYTRINLAHSLIKLSVFKPESLENFVNETVKLAQNLGDDQTIANALGNLSELYEKTGQLDKAKAPAEKALELAQKNNALDIAFGLQAQLGRILGGKTDKESRELAIAYYGQSVENLKAIRSDLVAANRDVQFSFKETVEPVYRQFVDLLLQTEGKSEPSQENLKKARETIESLQLAELEDFFRAACLEPKEQLDDVLDKVAPSTAIIYPIILNHRLDVVIKLPGKTLHYHSNIVEKSTVESTLTLLRGNLLNGENEAARKRLRLVYSWLVEPFEEYLKTLKKANHIPTLVFVLDGSLRNIPMAALHNGEQYLAENYAIALSPSLQLFELRPLKQKQLKILAAAISEKLTVESKNFDPISNALVELQRIGNVVYNKRVENLENSQFTETNLQKKIQLGTFSVVHMATHGQFSSDPKETFLLIHDQAPGNNGKLLNIEDLRKLLQISDQNSPIKVELLVLSACYTAQGDDRAILGLAGVAVRAGARSTLSTLWEADSDATADLMEDFYRRLGNSEATKAEALHSAQVALMEKYKEPLKWAPYVLVGNWL